MKSIKRLRKLAHEKMQKHYRLYMRVISRSIEKDARDGRTVFEFEIQEGTLPVEQDALVKVSEALEKRGFITEREWNDKLLTKLRFKMPGEG